VKFLVDMPLSPALALWLRERGHDAVHVSAIGLGRATDAEIIYRATDEARTIVTADLDYPRLLALTHAAGPALMLFRGGDWSDPDIVTRMASLLDKLSDADDENSIFVVERDRVRRRRLPIR
jgi:predicted nuclease of predicted toxin-antitoxin system